MTYSLWQQPDRLVLSCPAGVVRIIGSMLAVALLATVVLGVAGIIRDGTWANILASGFCCGALLWALTLALAPEVTATFDLTAKTVTIDRERPIGRRTETHTFADIQSVGIRADHVSWLVSLLMFCGGSVGGSGFHPELRLHDGSVRTLGHGVTAPDEVDAPLAAIAKATGLSRINDWGN